MKLSEILKGINVLSTAASGDTEITGVCYDSRRVKSGDLFVAVRGYESDGHKYIPMAVEKGCAAVLCEEAPAGNVPYVQTDDSRLGLALAARNFYGDPSREMKVIGITGTNGKTTTTILIKQILEKTLGAKVGLIGSISNMIGDEEFHAEHTTPESCDLQALFRQMADAGCTHCVMEVSSHSLVLRRVAGVSAATAKNIVAWREEEGAFTSRAQLKKVKGLGPKAYEQCAGFLRLPEAKNRLDATAVHPESYAAAKALLDACGYTAAEIGTDKLADLPGVVRAKGAGTLCEALGVGEPTLNDIVAELCKPGRDVRDSLPKPLLRSDVMGLDDLKPGMELTGTVRNVIDFGAFVDLGVHQDGLVHVSQISDKFIKHPREVLKVGDIVRVRVLNVDTAKKRIALTMKGVPQQN